ncbi:hypothetical protein [Vibrio splendidus]|uniref:hypothetical protein n=1 Tax=Vibrio splendidus TaxID=29497 RepID=UPI000C81DEF5|nr:hypothetical protein [Vibrio splendidus]PMP37989.1 hypothetical protein BCS86_22045 [Vibrio splendidus]
MKDSDKSILPIVFLIGAVLIPLTFILGIVVGTEIQMSTALPVDTLPSWVSAIATVAISVLTFSLAKETWHLRIAQVEQLSDFRKEMIKPNIEFGLSHSKAGSDLVELKVNSNGKGIAKNISFEIYDEKGRPLVYGANFVTDRLLSLRFITDGIKSLGSEHKIETFLFSFSEGLCFRTQSTLSFDVIRRLGSSRAYQAG